MDDPTPNPAAMLPTANEGTERRSRLWPGMVFGLLGLNVCVVGLTVYAAHFRSSSFAVETDYDRKALNWDETARQQRHNADLGWDLRLDELNSTQVTARLHDRQGRPLEGATVEAVAFHHAHAASKLTGSFAALDGTPGVYVATMAIERPGLWEFQFTVTRGSETFTRSFTLTLTGAREGSNP